MKKGVKNVLGVFSIMALLTLLLSCVETKRSQSKEFLKHFDKISWVNDSLACDGTRIRLGDTVGKYSYLLMGMSRKQIKHILGRPNY